MKLILFLCLSTCLFLNQNLTDRSVFYKVLSGESQEDIEHLITGYENRIASPLSNAYLGALYMKKTSYIKPLQEKISVFNKGKDMLESEILNSPNNVEMRFVRLIIQENSPKILKYNSQLEGDKEYIISNFSKLSQELKNLISDYSKTSTVLNTDTFK